MDVTTAEVRIQPAPWQRVPVGRRPAHRWDRWAQSGEGTGASGRRGRGELRGGAPRRSRATLTAGLVNRLINGRAVEWQASVQVYPTDVVVRRRMAHAKAPRVGGGHRGRIVGLSAASARNLSFIARNVEGLETMLTLTYPAAFPTDGRLVKAHWTALRRWLAHRGLGGLWWLEFQDRGAPHLHVYMTGQVDKLEIAKAWYRIVGSGDLRHLVAGTRIERIRNTHAVAAYAAKYTSKQAQKIVPAGFENVGRFWGCFGGVKPRVKVEVAGELSPEVEVDTETGELREAPSLVAQVVRVVRAANTAKRRSWGGKQRRDNGKWSFRAWDVGGILSSYLGRVQLGGAVGASG